MKQPGTDSRYPSEAAGFVEPIVLHSAATQARGGAACVLSNQGYVGGATQREIEDVPIHSNGAVLGVAYPSRLVVVVPHHLSRCNLSWS